ncbi:MAG TPA: M42 family metallopeptidase [Fimbriimonadaceae bacterium]|nr:M42 family metallopeptidase [Fimbriimonadaceae bacterium]HRJ96526.1 M42 family metallopeptidase [Fimbriimonadaceae bacterium]
MARFTISRDYLVRFLTDLLNTPSPTGDTDWAIGFVQQELESLGIASYRTYKGALVAHLEGLKDDRPRAITAHVDTLGAMVSEIKKNGRLKLTRLNGLMWHTIESEGVWVATRQGRQIRGSVVLENGAAHVNRKADEDRRTADNLEVRLDERTASDEETRVLGIDVGDFVYFDPRVEVSDAGFVRSRFLDDKACVACAVAALKALRDAGVSPAQRTHVLFSNYEEVGHGGMDGLPEDLAELVVADMAVVGEGRQGDEFHCSICVKDSSGPYSRRLTEKLRTIAERAGVDLKSDIYPHYGSDGSVYWQAGGRAEVALIGPGVDTSHGYERTHSDALVETALLIAEYLIEE